MSKTVTNLTIIILTNNVAQIPSETLTALSFCSNIVFIDNSSKDVVNLDFAQKRNLGLKRAQTEWIMYVDSDEIVTQALKTAIVKIISTNKIGAYRIRRQNFFLGKQMYDDYVDRLFHRTIITHWYGQVHESPILLIAPTQIDASLIHHTHHTITSMLEKTNQWSEYEAKLRLDAKHPLISWWRLIRIALTYFISNYIGKKLYRYGREGLFEAYFQAIDKLIVYTKLWELQQKKR